MTTHIRTTFVLLAISIALLTTAIVLGIVAALQFRDFVQYGYHLNGSCMALPGHPGPSTALAWIALGCAASSLLSAGGAILTASRSLLLVPAISLAVSSAVAMWMTWRVIDAITLCAPYASG
jgi:hypothetical protein